MRIARSSRTSDAEVRRPRRAAASVASAVGQRCPAAGGRARRDRRERGVIVGSAGRGERSELGPALDEVSQVQELFDLSDREVWVLRQVLRRGE